jgi:hypothetical protein
VGSTSGHGAISRSVRTLTPIIGENVGPEAQIGAPLDVDPKIRGINVDTEQLSRTAVDVDPDIWGHRRQRPRKGTASRR